MEIVYFAHGTTKDNEKHIASGWDQLPLSALGVSQMSESAFKVDVNEFDAIFCSDLNRSIESANLLFPKGKKKIVIDSRLRECNYGIFTKKPNSEVVYSNHISTPFPEGESLKEVESRIRLFINDIQLNNYKKIAIVSHRAPQLALDVIFANLSWEEAIERDWRKARAFQLGWSYFCS